MQQILNGFKEYYYIDENGKVYNSKTNKMLIIDNYNYHLRTTDNTTKHISLKKLYKLVFKRNFCIDNITNLEGERWRPIDQESGYFISNLGRIKSVLYYEAILLKPYITNNGYLRIALFINGKVKNYFIHRLVAEAFCKKPNGYNETYQVHHKNFINTDNKSTNLQWVSIEEHNKIHYEKEKKDNGK